MDNEASQELKRAIIKNKITYQLTPPNIHRTNAAERAIRTYKNHFLSGLATVDPDFPVAEWDRLLSQATISLNLLRNTRINPRLSAYAYVYGTYDFNCNPMAPPGTKVVIHDKPQQRASWNYHGSVGFYISPSTEHYRCMKCYIPTTRQVRVADTIQFFPKNIDFPAISINEHLSQALDTLTTILRQKSLKPHDNILKISQSNMEAIELLTTIIRCCTPTPIQIQENTTKKFPFTCTQETTTTPVTTSTMPTGPGFTSSNDDVKDSTDKAQLPRVNTSTLRRICQLKAHCRMPKYTQQYYNKKIAHIFDKITGKKMTIRQLLQNPNTTEIWSKSASNEFGRLMTGNKHGVEGTEAMCVIHPSDIPTNKAITYATVVCDHRPLKTEQYRCRLVVGGDKLPYASDSAAPAANLVESKILFNSTISQPTAKFMTIDISNFFLSSLMHEPEFMKMIFLRISMNNTRLQILWITKDSFILK